LPSWEYIPDGEPHVFDGRIYIYGSHDKFNGYVFCMGDYVCYSAPVDNLADWRYEGLIYEKTADPLNREGKMCLYAPDVTRGPDGRYYLYYALDKVSVISVAVCDSPAGKYEFHGHVSYSCGTRYGERQGDQYVFDPAVITEGEKTYLYTGFCGEGQTSHKGAMATVLAPDMLTVTEEPVCVAPGRYFAHGTSFAGHEFFEAPSVRKRGDTYYLIYSSIAANELCYATSKNPLGDFVYRGVIISNCDMGISTYKPAEKPMHQGGNNHGSIIEINGQWYIFYHRHTNNTWFCRQACAERIEMQDDGTILQVEMTSCGLNETPLIGQGEYPAYLACNLFSADDSNRPKLTQDGKDGDEEIGYVTDIKDACGVGFKYFDFKGITKIKIKTRGYNNGVFEVKTSWNGIALGCIPVKSTNLWEEFSADITIPDGIHALYFVYKGTGTATLGAFTLVSATPSP